MRKVIDTVRYKFKLLKPYNGTDIFKVEKTKLGKLEWKTFTDYINIASSSYNINIYINPESICYIEFSLPKLIRGHNLDNGDIKELVHYTNLIYIKLKEIGIIPPPWKEWLVMRIDISENKYCEDIISELRLYQTADFKSKKKYIYSTSVMYVGATYSIKIYNKQEEFLKNDYLKIQQEEKKSYLLGKAQGLLRYEVTYRSQGLKNIFHRKKMHLKDLVANFEVLLNHYEKTIKSVGFRLEPKALQQNEVLKLLSSKFGHAKTLQLYQFYILYSTDELNKKILKDFYSRSTFYRRTRELKKLKII